MNSETPAPPRYFLLGSATLDEEGDVWVAVGYADSLDESGIPAQALPLACSTLGDCAVLFLIVDGVVRGFVRRREDKPLSWLDFGWLCATWPAATMVFLVPLAEMDELSAELLSTMNEFTDGEAANDAAAVGGDQ